MNQNNYIHQNFTMLNKLLFTLSRSKLKSIIQTKTRSQIIQTSYIEQKFKFLFYVEVNTVRKRKNYTKYSPRWKRLDMSWEGSVGRLGAKNLEAKYQNTATLMIPVIVCPKPPACCCLCGCPPPPSPPPAAAAGGAIFFFFLLQSSQLRCKLRWKSECDPSNDIFICL